MCTFPSRPRVGPPSRPMYCAKIRHGSTPRVMWTPMSRWSGVPTSFGPIAVADADRGGLVPAARVERARDLALLVEDVPALLDPARDQHVAVDAEQVLAVEARLLHLLQRAYGLGFTYGHQRSPVVGSGRAHSNDCACGVDLPLRRVCRRGSRRSATGSRRSGGRRSATGSRSASAAATRSATSSSSRRELPSACPQCGGELRHRCPACERADPVGVRGRVRGVRRGGAPAELFGTPIRKPGR